MSDTPSRNFKYLIVGNSAAAVAAAEAIHLKDPQESILMVSSDEAFYSRCQLHMIASGRRSSQAARFIPQDWETRHNVTFFGGKRVSAIDREAAQIVLESGETIGYQRLLLATGSRTAMPPVKNLQGSDVLGFRNIEDARDLAQRLKPGLRVLIIGAGLVGSELAVELVEKGFQTLLVEMAPYPLPLQLESLSGQFLGDHLQALGVELICSDLVREVLRDKNGRVAGVLLGSGRTLDCDLIICAAGVRANMEIAEEAGIRTDRGILIDDSCATSDPRVFAAGDVTQFRDSLAKDHQNSQMTPIWPTAVHQGKVAGINMSGGDARLERITGLKTSANIHGLHIVSLGSVSRPSPQWTRRVSQWTDALGRENLRILFTQGDQIRGAILMGDIRGAGVYLESMLSERHEGDLPDWELFSLETSRLGYSEKPLNPGYA